MFVCVTTEQRFNRTPDGKVWTVTVAGYSFWRRYREVFDDVRVVARVKEVDSAEASWKRADGEGVAFHAVPYYVGPAEFVRKFVQVRSAARTGVSENGALILRVASQIALFAQGGLPRGRPFGIEVVGDPYDVFAPGAVNHPLRPFLRWYWTRAVQRACRKAATVSFVTERSLQARYPVRSGTFATSYSSIELPTGAFAAAPRIFSEPPKPLRIVTVGSLAQMYKGFDVLIEALGLCVAGGLDAELTIIGDGRYRELLQRQVSNSGLDRRVIFTGELPAGAAVLDQLDRAHMFVLPSKTEGLPRAMIEAMARALPCIGSAVGGIPELLPPAYLTRVGDPDALAKAIASVAADPQTMSAMSAANMAKAQAYSDSVLMPRRLEFMRRLRSATEEWLAGESRLRNV